MRGAIWAFSTLFGKWVGNMAHKPRSGSIGYYPRVRAKRETAIFTTFVPSDSKEAKPRNFFGYKAGMVHLFGKNAHEKSQSFGQETMIPSTVIECPPAKIIGARVYGNTTYGLTALGEATTDKVEKNLRKKIKAFKKHGTKKKEDKKYWTVEELEKLKEKAVKVALIAEFQPGLTGFGKKKADIVEINISGNVEQQFAFAKEKFGKEMRISEVFAPSQFIDVKAVDKGKGFSGVVKRFGVKVHRPKAKKHRYVGSIGPWHPATVMWTVARAGQLGYQTRTEYNKRILIMDGNPSAINPKAGFLNYGNVKNEYIVISGSAPGPAKRIVALRHAARNHDVNMAKYSDIKVPHVDTGVKIA